MGFLHKLWDETVAGPAPETGLGKLRKYGSFSAVRSPPPLSSDHVAPPPPPPVTRSITVLKGDRGGGLRKLTLDPGHVPDSPVGSSNPGTPLTPGTPGGYFGRFAAGKKPSTDEADATSLAAYDWIIINALDR